MPRTRTAWRVPKEILLTSIFGVAWVVLSLICWLLQVEVVVYRLARRWNRVDPIEQYQKRDAALKVFESLDIPDVKRNFASDKYFLTAHFTQPPKDPLHLTDFASQFTRTNAFRDAYALNTFPSFILSDPAYTTNHLAFLTNKSHSSVRGGGYWFWKSTIANYLLQNFIVPDDAWLFYSDPDMKMEPQWISEENGQEHWEGFFWRMEAKGYEVLSGAQVYEERTWSKGDALDAVFGRREDGAQWHWDLPALQSGQFHAGFWVVRNTPNVRALFQEWAHLVRNYTLLSDAPSFTPNHESFRENRHDQTLFSLLLKRYCNEKWEKFWCGWKPKFDVPNSAELKIIWDMHGIRLS